MQPISNLPQNSHPLSSHSNNQPLNPPSQMPGILELGDRPIVSSGHYNLDFIDWNNEYEHIFSGLEPMNNQNQPFPGYNIPYGVSETTFAALIDQMQNNNEDDMSNGLPPQMLNQVKKIKMQEAGKECSVCFSELHKDEEVRKLPCSHIFHDGCLMPWLLRNTTCPNCRHNLFAFFSNNPTGEY